MKRIVTERASALRLAGIGPLVLLSVLACADGGKRLTGTGPPSPPVGLDVIRLVPARTVVGDTVRIEGSEFGSSAPDKMATFAGGEGRIAAEVLSWGDSAITVLVPAGAASGLVRVRAGTEEGGGKEFSVASGIVSFAGDLLPLLNGKGCVDCHSGDFATNHLRLETAADILRGGSDHGPAVVRRNGPGSLIVRKVSPDPPFGQRMPLGCTGACLSEEQILEISDWIDQGTRDN